MGKHKVKSPFRVLTAESMFKPGRMPLRLHYAVQSVSPGFHLHEFSEIAIVLTGRAKYHTEFAERQIVKGDVLCIPEGAGHSYSHEENVRIMNILFQFDELPIFCREITRLPELRTLFTLKLDFFRKHQFYPVVHLQDDDLARCDSQFQWLLKLQTQETSGYELALLGGFLELMTILANNYSVPFQLSSALEAPANLQNTINYLMEHYASPIKVSELAQRAHMSVPTYFRYFKLATGQSPINYLLHYRLLQAKDLLEKNVTITVDDIAFSCGFMDANYFSRSFKKKYGITPNAWRKNSQP